MKLCRCRPVNNLSVVVFHDIVFITFLSHSNLRELHKTSSIPVNNTKVHINATA